MPPRTARLSDEEIDRLAREQAAATAADVRAVREAPNPDPPTMDLDLSPEDYTFQATPVAPRGGLSGPRLPTSLSGAAQDAGRATMGTLRSANDWVRAHQPPGASPTTTPQPPAVSPPGASPSTLAEADDEVAALPETISRPPTIRGPNIPLSLRAEPLYDDEINGPEFVDDIPERPSPAAVEPNRTGDPMRPPSIGTDKSMAGQFGPSAKERDRLATARAEDERYDRRRRRLAVAGSIFSALGPLVPALMPLGRIMNAGSGAVRESDNAERVQNDIDQRQGADAALRNEQNAQRERASAEALQAQQAERQGRLDEANLGLIGARTQAATADAENAEFERASAEGDAAGMREAIRATVNGLNDSSGLANQWRAMVQSPEFERMSADSLRSFQATVGQLVNNRRAGLLEGGGGGGTRARAGLDAAGNPIIIPGRRASGGGGGAPIVTAQPAQAGGVGFTPAGAFDRPRAAMTRARTPGAAAAPGTAVPAAPQAPADPILAYINAHYPELSPAQMLVMQGAAQRQGVTAANIDQPAANRILTAAREQFNAESEGQRRMLAETGDTFGRSLNPNRPGPEITDERAFDRARAEMGRVYTNAVVPFQTAAYQMRRAVERYGEANVRLAMQSGRVPGGVDAATARGLGTLLGQLQTARERFGRVQSGAAISAAEWENFDRILGNTSIFSGPEQYIRAMQDLQGHARTFMRQRAIDYSGQNDPNDVIANFERMQRSAVERAARARAGGAR